MTNKTEQTSQINLDTLTPITEEQNKLLSQYYGEKSKINKKYKKTILNTVAWSYSILMAATIYGLIIGNNIENSKKNLEKPIVFELVKKNHQRKRFLEKELEQIQIKLQMKDLKELEKELPQFQTYIKMKPEYNLWQQNLIAQEEIDQEISKLKDKYKTQITTYNNDINELTQKSKNKPNSIALNTLYAMLFVNITGFTANRYSRNRKLTQANTNYTIQYNNLPELKEQTHYFLQNKTRNKYHTKEAWQKAFA